MFSVIIITFRPEKKIIIEQRSKNMSSFNIQIFIPRLETYNRVYKRKYFANVSHPHPTTPLTPSARFVFFNIICFHQNTIFPNTFPASVRVRHKSFSKHFLARCHCSQQKRYLRFEYYIARLFTYTFLGKRPYTRHYCPKRAFLRETRTITKNDRNFETII